MRWCVCTRARVCVTEYYSALRENEIPAFATMRTDLEGLVLSETSQTEKAKYHATSLRRGIRKRENPAEQLGATVYSLVGRPYLFISVLRAAVPGVTAGKSATHSQCCRIPCLPIAYRVKLRNSPPPPLVQAEELVFLLNVPKWMRSPKRSALGTVCVTKLVPAPVRRVPPSGSPSRCLPQHAPLLVQTTPLSPARVPALRDAGVRAELSFKVAPLFGMTYLFNISIRWSCFFLFFL